MLLIGPEGVGKTALINQFMTTESINVYDTKKGSLLLFLIKNMLYIPYRFLSFRVNVIFQISLTMLNKIMQNLRPTVYLFDTHVYFVCYLRRIML